MILTNLVKNYETIDKKITMFSRKIFVEYISTNKITMKKKFSYF